MKKERISNNVIRRLPTCIFASLTGLIYHEVDRISSGKPQQAKSGLTPHGKSDRISAVLVSSSNRAMVTRVTVSRGSGRWYSWHAQEASQLHHRGSRESGSCSYRELRIWEQGFHLVAAFDSDPRNIWK